MKRLAMMAVGLAGFCMLSMLTGCLSPTDYGSDNAMISTLRVRVSALEGASTSHATTLGTLQSSNATAAAGVASLQTTNNTHAGYFAAGANRSITNAPAATNVVAFSHGVATNLTTEP